MITVKAQIRNNLTKLLLPVQALDVVRPVCFIHNVLMNDYHIIQKPFPAQMASNAENISILWRHHVN